MIETVKTLLTSQYEASLCTVAHCVAKCPDALWNARVAKYPLCQTTFHTLFFAEYYLGLDPESLRQQPFHLSNPNSPETTRNLRIASRYRFTQSFRSRPTWSFVAASRGHDRRRDGRIVDPSRESITRHSHVETI